MTAKIFTLLFVASVITCMFFGTYRFAHYLLHQNHPRQITFEKFSSLLNGKAEWARAKKE